MRKRDSCFRGNGILRRFLLRARNEVPPPGGQQDLGEGLATGMHWTPQPGSSADFLVGYLCVLYLCARALRGFPRRLADL